MRKSLCFLILLSALLCGPSSLSAQYVYVQNEIWFDTWPGQAAGVTAITADYNSYYWYDLSVYGFSMKTTSTEVIAGGTRPVTIPQAALSCRR